MRAVTCADMAPGCSASILPGALPPLGRGGTATDATGGRISLPLEVTLPAASPSGTSAAPGRFGLAASTSAGQHRLLTAPSSASCALPSLLRSSARKEADRQAWPMSTPDKIRCVQYYSSLAQPGTLDKISLVLHTNGKVHECYKLGSLGSTGSSGEDCCGLAGVRCSGVPSSARSGLPICPPLCPLGPASALCAAALLLSSCSSAGPRGSAPSTAESSGRLPARTSPHGICARMLAPAIIQC